MMCNIWGGTLFKPVGQEIADIAYFLHQLSNIKIIASNPGLN